MTEYEWSKYQAAFFDKAKKSVRNIVVKATAGSGKTTILVELARMIVRGEVTLPSVKDFEDFFVAFLAFNKKIAVELDRRLPEEISASTAHSYSFGLLKKTGNFFKVNDYKYHNLAKAYIQSVYGDSLTWAEQTIAAGEIVEVVDMLRYNMADIDDEEQVARVAIDYSLSLDWNILPVYRAILQMGEALAVSNSFKNPVSALDSDLKPVGYAIWNNIYEKHKPNKREIDFIDMIYLALKWNLVDPVYDAVIIDETQDLSDMLVELVLRSVKPNGRIFAVGDESQSMYKFAGAGIDSMRNIVEKTEAEVLPLSITYRCPKSHVRLACQIDPQIEAAPWAEEGTVGVIDEHQFVEKIREIYKSGGKPIIMARRNAPLVQWALYLISQRIPAKVLGRDFSSQLVNIVKAIGVGKWNKPKKGFDWIYFNKHLEDWFERERTKLVKQDAPDYKLQVLEDKYESIRALWSDTRAQSIFEFIDEIKSLFDDESNVVTLMTVHKAKGLEAKYTFILEPSRMPRIRRGQSEDDWLQELHILFVALTRSNDEMYIVDDHGEDEIFRGVIDGIYDYVIEENYYV